MFKDRRNDTLAKICTDMATKTFNDQYPNGRKNCFVAVAIYPAQSQTFDEEVKDKIGYFYEYLFNKKYHLLVRYGFLDSETDACSLIQ